MTFKGQEIDVVTLLGKGKGGYSYLVSYEGKMCVLKKFHNEEVPYYTFSSPKLELELRDYQRLKDAGILIPELYLTDSENQMLLKQYIPGPTCFELVRDGLMRDDIISLVRAMCNKLYPLGLNIDYYPTNFLFSNNELYYIDYECNLYSDEWNFESWGIKYWSQTPEFLEVLKNE